MRAKFKIGEGNEGSRKCTKELYVVMKSNGTYNEEPSGRISDVELSGLTIARAGMGNVFTSLRRYNFTRLYDDSLYSAV